MWGTPDDEPEGYTEHHAADKETEQVRRAIAPGSDGKWFTEDDDATGTTIVRDPPRSAAATKRVSPRCLPAHLLPIMLETSPSR